MSNLTIRDGKLTVSGGCICMSSENATPETGYTSVNIGKLLEVPAGSFQRDATATNVSVISTSFSMSKNEITRQQFLNIMGTDPSDAVIGIDGVNTPVQQVNWYHAIAFCNKLSIAESLDPVYVVTGVDFATLTYAQIPVATNAAWNAAVCNWAANGYRLPTEMEWMWAAMGADVGNPGVKNVAGYAKPFAGSNGANVSTDYAWISTNSSGKAHAVGGKFSNELGLYDMSGNIFEWCWDFENSYPNGTLTDFHRDSGTTRINRGGSWNHLATAVTMIYRYYSNPYYMNNRFGFRVVRL